MSSYREPRVCRGCQIAYQIGAVGRKIGLGQVRGSGGGLGGEAPRFTVNMQGAVLRRSSTASVTQSPGYGSWPVCFSRRHGSPYPDKVRVLLLADRRLDTAPPQPLQQLRWSVRTRTYHDLIVTRMSSISHWWSCTHQRLLKTVLVSPFGPPPSPQMDQRSKPRIRLT